MAQIKINRDDFLNLYNLGYNDSEISKILDCSTSQISKIRIGEFGLKARRIKGRFFTINEKKLIELFNEGYSKKEMAEILNVKINTLQSYLIRLKLLVSERDKSLKKEPTDRQKNIIVGMFLGDSSINKSGNIITGHSIKQYEYHLFKINLLNSLKNSGIKISARNDKRTNRTYHTAFSVFSSTEFTKYLRNYYIPKKVICEDLLQYYNEESLTIHYMDDGYVSKPFHVKYHHFCTNGFDYDSVKLFSDFLLKRFNLKNRISKWKNQFMVIISDKESNLLFEEIVKPYFCESMLYKL